MTYVQKESKSFYVKGLDYGEKLWLLKELHENLSFTKLGKFSNIRRRCNNPKIVS